MDRMRSNSASIISCSLLVTLLLSAPVSAQYGGPFEFSDELDLTEEQQRRRNILSYGAIVTTAAAHNVAIPFGFVPEPTTSIVAESTQVTLDTALKQMKAYLVAPPDVTFMPDSPDGCTFQLDLPQSRTTFSNNLGFTPRLGDDFLLIPDDWPTFRDEPISFGQLGLPEIFHANTDVILTLESFTAGIAPLNAEDVSGPVQVPAGSHEVIWRAETQWYPIFDTIFPGAMIPVMLGVEAKFSKYLDNLLAARAKRAKVIMGSARENLPALTRTLRKLNRRVNVVKFINRRLDSNLLDYLGLGQAILDIDDLSDRFGIGVPTVARARAQGLTVYDIWQPTIATSRPIVDLEATDIGGVAYARYAHELTQSIAASDRCGRTIQVTNDAPEFLPLGETVITWTVRDTGPALPGTDRDGDGEDDPVNINQVTQVVNVADTQAPIIVPPPGLVVESTTPIDLASHDLGQPLVVDLADLNPDVGSSSPDADGQVEVDTRTVVTWAATDHATTPNVSTADQLVTVKTPGTNTPPVADPKAAETLTAKPVDIVLTASDADELPYSHDPEGPVFPDPLQFRIETPPQDGEFESPLLPFFIDDYRTDETGAIYDEAPAIAARRKLPDTTPPTDEEIQAVIDDYIRAVNNNSVALFLDNEFCAHDIAAPLAFVWEPLYTHVRDNGEQYFFDQYLECDPNGSNSPPWEVYPRISRWSAAGDLVGHVRIDDGGGGIVGNEAVFRIDDEDFVYFVENAPGEQPALNIQRCPAALDDVSVQPGSCQDQGFGPVDSSHVSHPDDAGSLPENALVDIERELVYVVAGQVIAVFDYRHEIEGDPNSPRRRQAVVDWLTNDAGSRNVLDDGSCAGPGNSPFLNAMEVDSEGNLYVTDNRCHRIHKFSVSRFDAEGTFVRGEYIGWMGKCSASNNLACDVDNQRTKGFSCTVAAACTVAGSIEDGDAAGQFSTPAFLAIDPNDILYVADYDNRRIQRFGVDGLFAGQAASTGNGINAGTEGGFVLGNMGPPKHVSVNSKNFFVVDQSENFVHIFDTSPFKDITESSATVTYVSEFAFHSATDSFTYSVNDGLADSTPVAVTIDVARNYRQPQPEARSVNILEDRSVIIVLRGTDPDGIVSRDFNGLDSLTFVISEQPSSGTLVQGGDPGEITLDPGMDVWTYTPDPDFFGDDTFSFTVRDAFTDETEDAGTPIPEPYGEAEPALVAISVAPVNDVPIVRLHPPERIAAGFPIMLEGEVFDDYGLDHTATVDWGDGTIDYRGEILIDDNGTPNDADDDTVSFDGVILNEDSLLSIGQSRVNALHTFTATGPRSIRLCVQDNGHLETCRSVDALVESLAVVGVEMTLTQSDIRDGIVFNGTIDVMNEIPAGGVAGLDAANVVLEVEIAPEIVVQQFNSTGGACSIDQSVLACDFGTIASGAAASVDLELRGSGTLFYDTVVDFFAEVRTDTPSLEEVAAGAATVTLRAIDLDRDGDGMSNIFEGVTGVADPDADDDGDGLTNREEFEAGTSPNDADTDGDGIGDGDELNTFASDPLESDTDNDGIADSDEVNLHGTDPASADTDDDGLPDNWEVDNGYDPLVADSDGDADADGLSDRDEYANESDHLNPDTDGDTLADGDEVFVHDTDPALADTDADGLDDNDEVAAGTNPNKPDSDDDDLYDGTEVHVTATLPLVTDTDRDGLDDGFEDRSGRNPLVADYGLAAGGLSSCALTDLGVECWGRNDFNQAPAIVPGLNDPEQVTVGYVHACAIDRDADGNRSVSCWGNNGFGQLTVPALADPFQIAAGGYHTCALDRTAPGTTAVVCWGRNNLAQLSVPGGIEQPVRLVAAISGNSSCVLDNKQLGPALVCWGQYNNANSPVPNISGSVQALAHGSEHACVVDGGQQLCWGLNDDGQAPPGPLPMLAVELSLGGFHSCALESVTHNDYAVDCRGLNADLQTEVPANLLAPISLASGSHHSCAFDSGSARCWGARASWDRGQAPDTRSLSIDPDGDGLQSGQEAAAGTNPLDADSDGDRINDDVEIQLLTDPNDIDSDDDGLSDGDEILVHQSNPLSNDTDGDGMDDEWEVDHGLLVGTADAAADADGDGLDNGTEYAEETDPTVADSDGDGIGDGTELQMALDPTEPDTDGDGTYDGWEVDHGFDPLDDADGLLDPDGDGLSNFGEFRNDTDPFLADSDGDGIPDGWEVDNGLDPLLADSDGDLDRDGLDNLGEYRSGGVAFADDVAPVLTIPADVLADSIGPFTNVDIGTATAVDARDGAVTAQASDTGPFPPGPNVVTWSAADLSGNTVEGPQGVGVVPLVDFAVGQIVDEGDSIVVPLMLNGQAVDYPVQANYTVSGGATNPEDHDATDGSVMIETGVDGSIPVNIVLDAAFEGEETFTFSFTDIVNAVPGSQTSHTVTITQANVKPVATIVATQSGETITTAAASQGPVTITATVIDPNTRDTHLLDWSASDSGIFDPAAASAVSYAIDPATLNAGFYRIVLDIIDDGSPPAVNRVETLLSIVAAAPQLSSSNDSDGDGIDDVADGFNDRDSDRIPDYLDPDSDGANVIPYAEGNFVLQTQPGLRLRLGDIAFRNGSVAGISEAVVAQDVEVGFPDLVADFEILGVEPGASALVVIPLRYALPDNAAYRKFVGGNWQDFVVDAGNSLSSAPGNNGACPAPGTLAYTPGLNAGNGCIQVEVLDGGPNDVDGLDNGVIRDPGGLAVPVAVRLESLPVADSPASRGSNVIALAFSLVSDSGDAELDGLTLTASGSGDDTSIRAVSLVVDENRNGVVDSGETSIGEGVFQSDNGTLDLQLLTPFAVPPGRTDFLVTYDF